MKKKLFITILAIAAVICLASCSNGEQKTTVNAKVKISSDYTLLESNVTINGAVPNAANAVIEACKANKIAYNVKDGMFDGFGGIESSKEEGWLLYLNGTLAATGAEETNIYDDDIIEFRYENYEKAFNSINTDYMGKWRCETAADGSAAFLTLDEAEASFTYIDAERTTLSYVGRYSISNNKIVINDVNSGSVVSIPFSAAGTDIIITYNAQQIQMSKQ